jgi:hypothetical protein
MNMLADNMHPIRVIREVYDVETRSKGEYRPLNSAPFATLTEARDAAARRSRASGLPVIELSYREDIKNETRDGVFVCVVRRDEGIVGWPRVWA